MLVSYVFLVSICLRHVVSQGNENVPLTIGELQIYYIILYKLYFFEKKIKMFNSFSSIARAIIIVGLFDSQNSIEQQIFELAVQKVNVDPMFSNVFLKSEIQIVDSTDTYMTGLKGTQSYMKILY